MNIYLYQCGNKKRSKQGLLGANQPIIIREHYLHHGDSLFSCLKRHVAKFLKSCLFITFSSALFLSLFVMTTRQDQLDISPPLNTRLHFNQNFILCLPETHRKNPILKLFIFYEVLLLFHGGSEFGYIKLSMIWFKSQTKKKQ